MNDVNLFINTRVKDSGILAGIGDFALSPVRYFFHGRTVKVVNKENHQHVHHVASYKGKGGWFAHHSKTNNDLKASSRGFFKALAMIVLFAPGLILGTIAKSFAYLSNDMRANHSLAKRHFTPVDKTVGSEDNRLDENGIKEELTKLKNDPLHQKVNNLVIYGNGNVTFNTDPGFVSLNPKKVVMVGARIIHAPCAFNRLDDTLARKKEWLDGSVRNISSGMVANNSTFVTQLKVSSVKDALDHVTPRRSFLSSKRYHAVYQVNA